MTFDGFSTGAIAFYRGLEADNSRAYWTEHRDAYEREVRAPMLELTAALAEEFGEAKLFRPNRDVRFSHDKSPYKTHQGAVIITGESAHYVEISGDGICAGGGIRGLTPSQLTGMRAAIGEDGPGDRFDALARRLEHDGFELLGDQLKTSPRGFSVTHPRIRWLRYREFLPLRLFGEPSWLDSPAVIDRVRDTWRALAEFHAWISAHVPAPSKAEHEARRPGRRR